MTWTPQPRSPPARWDRSPPQNGTSPKWPVCLCVGSHNPNKRRVQKGVVGDPPQVLGCLSLARALLEAQRLQCREDANASHKRPPDRKLVRWPQSLEQSGITRGIQHHAPNEPPRTQLVAAPGRIIYSIPAPKGKVARTGAPDLEDPKMGPCSVVKLVAKHSPRGETSLPRTRNMNRENIGVARRSVSGLGPRPVVETMRSRQRAPRPRRPPPNHRALGRSTPEGLPHTTQGKLLRTNMGGVICRTHSCVHPRNAEGTTSHRVAAS